MKPNLVVSDELYNSKVDTAGKVLDAGRANELKGPWIQGHAILSQLRAPGNYWIGRRHVYLLETPSFQVSHPTVLY